jgi:hypothetical protein
MKLTSAVTSLLFLASAQASDKMRFRKYNTTEEGLSKRSDSSINFPINQADADFLRDYTRSISVSRPDDECTETIDFQKVKDRLSEVKLYPTTYPEDDDFWEEFIRVVEAQKHLKTYQKNPCMTDPLPLVMPRATDLWKGFSIVDVAEAVHDEFQGIYTTQMIANWLTPGNAETVKFSNDAIPRKQDGDLDFIRGPIMLADLIGRGVRLCAPCNFSLKWEVGRPRPEEVAFAVDQRTLAVPKCVKWETAKILKDTLRDFDMKDPTDFTAYAEGSPTHPSWPAMHSAAASSSFWLDVVLELDEEQRCEAMMLDYSVSFARTVAGVHYEGDNLTGLTVGQEILAQRLPDILANEYGADRAEVQKRVDAKRFDWNGFENSPCYKSERFKTHPAAKPLFCLDQRGIPVQVSGDNACTATY